MAEATERQLLQVDAATELLRRHLTEAEQPLGRFERRATGMSAKVDPAVVEMGDRFGPFAKLAEDAATRAERAFEASVLRIAATVIKGPTIAGGVSPGAEEDPGRRRATQDQARALR